MIQEPVVVALVAAAGALLAVIVGGLAGTVARRRHPASAVSPGPVATGPASAASPGSVATGPASAASPGPVATGPASAVSPGSVATGPASAAWPGSVATGPASAVSPGPVATGPASAVSPGSVATGPASAASPGSVATAPVSATAPHPGGPVPAGAAGTDAGSRMVGALRQRPWLRRGLSLAAVVMVAGAVGLLGYPVYTNVVQHRIQTRLEGQLASPRFRQVYLTGQVAEGDSLTRLRIPSIDVDVVVVEGTSASALRAGAGHYPSTPLPCQAGNVAVAGHRTTYGQPFHDLHELAVGDEIVLDTPVGSCTYRVARAPFSVRPTDLSVVAPTPHAALTLTTCHPMGSAAERLVVRAELVTPEGQVA